MDFGVVGFEGGGGYAEAVSAFAFSDASAAAEAKQKWCGSGFLKQERPGINTEDDLRDFKVVKTSDDFLASKSMLLQQKSSLLRSNSSNSSPLSEGQEQMLSFSSPNSQTVAFPYYTSTTNSRNTGYGNGGFNSGIMHGGVNGVRGPFSPSQWMELEHQALIYKYITSNVPIPSCLLNPIRKALDSAGFSSFPGFRPNAMGWSAFHLGFSNNTDPEPGRCRRTDGKKWRCSREAVADQKYCERHMNRGRHRSRKPVEGQGQSGHSVSGTTGVTTKLAVASTTSAAVVSGGGPSSTLGFSHHQLNNLQPGATNSSSVSQQLNRNYGSSKDLNDHGTKSQHPLRQFMDDWPKNQSESSAVSWSNIDVQSDVTQLSISIPMATTDYMSSTSSPNNEKLTNSPLRLMPELEATQMGLGVGTTLTEQVYRQGNLIPISWESSMGGPLGEVLQSTNNTTADCRNSSALNLMTEGWDTSPGMALSPTGVLQKAAIGSLSNSSAGSSPRPENNKTQEGASISNGLLGSTLLNSSLPAL